MSGAGDATVQALSTTARPPPGRRTRFGDLATVPTAANSVVTRHEQHTLLLAGVDRQRERHAREDDDVVQRDKEKRLIKSSLSLGAYE